MTARVLLLILVLVYDPLTAVRASEVDEPLRDPHPALAAAVPFNPVVDVWKADDWFHWGAFRVIYAFDYIYSMQTKPGTFATLPYGTRGLYTWMLGRGAADPGVA